MPRTCTICQHAECAAIDDALIAGEPYRSIAQRFAASPDSVYRHKQEHLPITLVKAQAAKEVVLADSLLDRINHLERRALAILETAEAAGAFETALRAIREARACLEVCAKLRGELQQEGTTNITINTEVLRIVAVLKHALAPWPEAQQAAARALWETEHDDG